MIVPLDAVYECIEFMLELMSHEYKMTTCRACGREQPWWQVQVDATAFPPNLVVVPWCRSSVSAPSR